MLAEFGPGDHRGPLVEQPDQRAQQARLALTALAQQNEVVTCDECAFQLRQHGLVESKDSGPYLVSGGQRRQKVLPEFLLDSAFTVTGGAQFADGSGQMARCRHHSTLRPLSTCVMWTTSHKGLHALLHAGSSTRHRVTERDSAHGHAADAETPPPALSLGRIGPQWASWGRIGPQWASMGEVASAGQVEGDAGAGGRRGHLVVAHRTARMHHRLDPAAVSVSSPSGNGKNASEAATAPRTRSPRTFPRSTASRAASTRLT